MLNLCLLDIIVDLALNKFANHAYLHALLTHLLCHVKKRLILLNLFMLLLLLALSSFRLCQMLEPTDHFQRL